MNTCAYYFAYGSNLHPRRLLERTPSARFVGRATLADWRLNFRMRSRDGSGKCHIEPASGALVHGVVYRLRAQELAVLDSFEGGYRRVSLTLAHPGGSTALTYLALEENLSDAVRPYTWYRAFVAHGARMHGLPHAYCQQLARVPAIVDPDPGRAARNLRTLAATHTF